VGGVFGGLILRSPSPLEIELLRSCNQSGPPWRLDSYCASSERFGRDFHAMNASPRMPCTRDPPSIALRA
jgi:hypothetical protein